MPTRLLTETMPSRETPSQPDCLIVVRRTAESTYRYLKDRLTGVHGVEVTLDRRATPSTPSAPARPGAADERRGRSQQFNALDVLLVRR